MKITKKILAILLAVTMILALAACGKKPVEQPKVEAPKVVEQPVEAPKAEPMFIMGIVIAIPAMAAPPTPCPTKALSMRWYNDDDAIAIIAGVA